MSEINPERTELLAVGSTLHAFYNGIERILMLIGKTFGDFNDSQKQTTNWHQGLLSIMACPTSSRPAVISHELHQVLLEYLKFRHVFRQSYIFDLRWTLMLPLLRQIMDAHQKFMFELESFMKEARLL